jgi:hypothetical protein
MKKDFPNVPDFVVSWMLDVYDKDPDFFKKESKKLKSKPHALKPKEQTTLPQCEIQSVQVKFAEKPKMPLKLGTDGFIKVDLS